MLSVVDCSCCEDRAYLDVRQSLEIPLSLSVESGAVDTLRNVNAVGQDINVLQWSLNS